MPGGSQNQKIAWAKALGALARAPSFWIGAGAGLFFAYQYLRTGGPVGGTIAFGLISGFAVGAVAQMGYLALRAFSAERADVTEKSDAKSNAPEEEETLELLRRSGLETDAWLLEKMLRDRAAIQKAGASGATGDLIDAIAKKASRELRQLAEFHGMMENPNLKVPAGTEEWMDQTRDRLKHASQALAEARTRVRHEQNCGLDPLCGESGIVLEDTLEGLSQQLETETESFVEGTLNERVLGGGESLPSLAEDKH